MISVNFSIHLNEPDALIMARNAVFLAMFERAADQMEQAVYRDKDDSYVDVHADGLNTDLAIEFLKLLDQVSLLEYITADVSTSEELTALSQYAPKAAIERIGP